MSDAKKILERELLLREMEKRYSPARESFASFVETFFKLYHKKEWRKNWHYEEIYKGIEDLLNDEIDWLVINVPPQTGKSEIISKLLPLYTFGKIPDARFIVSGYSASLTETFSAQTRDYYNSDEYKRIFPRATPLQQQNASDWGDGHFSYRAVGVGGTITGKSSDFFVIDDPLNASEVAVSDNSIHKVNTWFSSTAISRLSPIGRKKMLIIMQRLHDNDLTGYILRKFKEEFEQGRFRHICIDAEQGEGQSFFPELLTWDELQNKKKQMTDEFGSNFYSAQYRQNPIDTETASIKRSYFQYYEPQDTKGKHLVGMIAVDPAISEKQTADYSAIAVVGKDNENKYYILEYMYGRWSSTELLKNILILQKNFGYDVAIETIGFQKTLVASLQEQMRIENQYFSIREIGSRGEKIGRLKSTLKPLYENLRVFHRKKDEYSELEDELLRMEKATHDDVIDAVETAISFLKGENTSSSSLVSSYKTYVSSLQSSY